MHLDNGKTIATTQRKKLCSVRVHSTPTRTPSGRSRSPLRELSPPSRLRAPQCRSEQRQKHRPPTPRSSTLVSPNYNYGWECEQARSGESEREVGRSRGCITNRIGGKLIAIESGIFEGNTFVMKPMIGI